MLAGAVVGEGLRIADSLLALGHKANFFIVDRAYSNGHYGEYAVPLRLRGFKHVITYREADLGEQAFDSRGFIQVSGTWYLDTLPKILRTADNVILSARNEYDDSRKKLENDITSTASELLKARTEQEKARDQAEELYRKQTTERAKSMLRPEGHISKDWTCRYLIPFDSPDYLKRKQKPGAYQGVTVSMKRPEGKAAEAANAGGLKHEQYFVWGSDEWCTTDGKSVATLSPTWWWLSELLLRICAELSAFIKTSSVSHR